MSPNRVRARRLLAAGCAAGILAAALGLAAPESAERLPDGAVARVNDRVIRAEDLDRALAALAADRRDPLTAEDRRHVLSRLIDEELLVQHGLELGLARHDRRIRADLTRAVISSVLMENEDMDVEEAALREFYEREQGFFQQPGALRVRQVFLRARNGERNEAKARAEEAARRLRDGAAFGEVREELGDPELPPLPGGSLLPAKLRQYLGPTPFRTVMELEVGEISDPVRSATGYHVFQVQAREPERQPPLEQIRAQVVTEYRRRENEAALRRYLDELRDSSDVAVAPELQ